VSATLLTFPEFLSLYDTDEPGVVSESWKSHWEKELPNFLGNPENYTHHGDCTNQPIRCVLCCLEDFLREYREYCEYFKSGKPIKDFFDNTF